MRTLNKEIVTLNNAELYAGENLIDAIVIICTEATRPTHHRGEPVPSGRSERGDVVSAYNYYSYENYAMDVDASMNGGYVDRSTPNHIRSR